MDRPRRGRVRRLLALVPAAIRAQPLLAVTVFSLTLLVGLTRLGMAPVAWRVGAEVRLGADLFSVGGGSPGSPLRGNVTPQELRDLLTSDPVVRAAELALSRKSSDEVGADTVSDSGLPSANAGGPTLASFRPWGVGRLLEEIRAGVLGMSARLAAALRLEGTAGQGASQRGTPSDLDTNGLASAIGDLRVHVADTARRDLLSGKETTVVPLVVRAPTPQLAQRAPRVLLEEVREVLRREDRVLAQRRLDELRPLREAAAEEAREAGARLMAYRIGRDVEEVALASAPSPDDQRGGMSAPPVVRHDPEASARDLESRLIAVRHQRAALETDLREAEAERFEIDRQMLLLREQGGDEMQTSRITLEENPRLRSLRDEISTLEARYAAEQAVKTERHPDMVRLRLEIESRRLELAGEERYVLREEERGAGGEWLRLLERREENARRLGTLTGRELGLAQTEALLTEQLAEYVRDAQRMEELREQRRLAEQRLRDLEEEHGWLQRRLSSEMPFANLTLVGEPQVRNWSRPDEPRVWLWLGAALAAAIGLTIVVPLGRVWWRDRLVGEWQVEEVAAQIGGHRSEISGLRSAVLTSGAAVSRLSTQRRLLLPVGEGNDDRGVGASGAAEDDGNEETAQNGPKAVGARSRERRWLYRRLDEAVDGGRADGVAHPTSMRLSPSLRRLLREVVDGAEDQGDLGRFARLATRLGDLGAGSEDRDIGVGGAASGRRAESLAVGITAAQGRGNGQMRTAMLLAGLWARWEYATVLVEVGGRHSEIGRRLRRTVPNIADVLTAIECGRDLPAPAVLNHALPRLEVVAGLGRFSLARLADGGLLRELDEALRQRYSRVVWSLPTVGGAWNVGMLAGVLDCVVLSVGRGTTPRGVVEDLGREITAMETTGFEVVWHG